MRVGILIAFMAGAVGYVLLSQAPTLALALLSVALAHGGGSTISVFSTTLLQRFTDAKFRGRVFAADLAVSTLVIAVSGYLAGVAIDRGVGVGAVAFWTGAAMLVPGLMWLWAMCLWREQEGQH